MWSCDFKSFISVVTGQLVVTIFFMLLHDLVSRIRIEGKGATVMAFSSRFYSEAEA